ncbi:M16 family metallopeptidase [Alteriqipengyuania lutimaris]|nr:insulinase family protein [Alteriqipengyuania lutimaris]MBB3033852.1 zinc protease [Alteriqipengyuania lutimaris]
MHRLSRDSRFSSSFMAIAVGLSLALASGAAAQTAPSSTQDGNTQEAAQRTSTGVPEWGIESPAFEADPDVVFGVLPNGMRYALQRNATPPDEAAIRFNVQVGSREETAAENGAAHFVEHMAFNGSTDIPEGDLLPILERLGLAFGADTNAETSLDYTTYKLALPNLQDETVDTALMVIREMAGELTFDPDAVERERGILLSEAQVRNNPQRRRGADYLAAALPGSRLGDRINADVERIRNISAADLRAFYEGYYRPERATLVIVGDFDVAEMQRKVEAEFSDWQGEGEARPLYDGPVASPSQPAISNFVDPSITEIVELQRISDWDPTPNTVEAQRDEALRAIAGVALSNRINALSRAADSPTLGGQVAGQPLFRSARSYGLLTVAKDGQWRETLALAEQELRRAQQYGFTSDEIVEAKANIETALTNAVAQADGRSSAALAEGLVAASLNEAVPLSPEGNLAFYRAIEPSLTAEAVSGAFQAAWQDGPSVVHVSTKRPIEGGEAKIAAALQESASVAVAPPAEAEAVEFAYSEWGEPGRVVADETIADLGIRTVRFENGLQLNMKVTDFEPGRIAFSMRVGEGTSAFPTDKPGLQQLVPIAISLDGLEAHTPDELRRVLAGEQVALGLSGSTGALVSSGTTTKDDLELQLDLLAAQLTAPAWRPETQAQLAGVIPVAVNNIRSAPTQVLSAALNSVLAGGDARLGTTEVSRLAELSLDDVRAAVAPQLAQGALAVGLVGDFDPEAAISAVAATLGTLPAREVRSESVTSSAPVSFVEDRSPVTLTHTGESDQGALSLSWKTDDSEDLRDDITRDLLAAVMTLRLTETLREELGTTYSPQAFSFSQSTYDGFGHLTAVATVAPEAMDDAARVVREIAAEMAAEPVADDLLERARNPIREGYERAESANSGWVSLVAAAQSDPDLLDRRRARLAILNEVTPATIQAAARTYLQGSAPVEMRVTPEDAD